VRRCHDILGIDIGTISVKYVRYRKKGKGIVVSRGEYPYKEGWEDLEGILSSIKNRKGRTSKSHRITSQEILKKPSPYRSFPRGNERSAGMVCSKIISIPLDDMRHEYVMLGEIDERACARTKSSLSGRTRVRQQDRRPLRGRRVQEDRSADRYRLYLLPSWRRRLTAPSPSWTSAAGRRHLYLRRQEAPPGPGNNDRLGKFYDVLISGFGLTFEEAESYTREKGFDETSSDILAVPMERLGGEIQRTFNVYAQKYPSGRCAVYCGRGAQIPNLLEKLKAFLVEDLQQLPSQTEIEDEFLRPICSPFRRTSSSPASGAGQGREKEAIYTKYARIAGSLCCPCLLY